MKGNFQKMKIKNIISTIILCIMFSNACQAFDLYTETDESNTTKASSNPNNVNSDLLGNNTSNKLDKEAKQEQIRALRDKERQKRLKLRQKSADQKDDKYRRRNSLPKKRKGVDNNKNYFGNAK